MSADYEAPRRRRKGLIPTAIGLVVAVAAGLGLYAAVTNTSEAASRSNGAAPPELEPVIELYNALTSTAVDAPDADALVEGAIEGMLDEVDDDYARYFTADDFADFNASLDGTFSGVGLLLAEGPDGPEIVSVLDGTPAQEAGIEQGERIVAVDGEDVADDDLEQIVAKVKGEAGTTVELGLAGGSKGRRTLNITRAEFDLPLVTSEMLDNDIGYVQLLQFADHAGDKVRSEVTELVDQGAKGIVFDLRRNPGGLLDEAVDVASVFIEDGRIVSVEQRTGDPEIYDAVDDAFEAIPLVVLVDEGSASASEIVAGAIQDADRGEIVGQTTFGKGTVQTISTFSDGSGAKFTTARYYTPSGDSIEEVGVEPDVELEPLDPDEPPTGPDDDPQVEAAAEVVGELVGAGN